jgi:formylglycine-generating enzyme required for sulfatase activity
MAAELNLILGSGFPYLTPASRRMAVAFGLIVWLLPYSASAGSSAPRPPGTIVLAQAPAASPAIDASSLEARYWNSIKDKTDLGDFRIYLDAWPNGLYAAEARARIERLSGKAPPPAAAPPATPVAPANAPLQDCAECPPMIAIAAGAFAMGSTELFRFEAPVHTVTIRKPFYLGRTEVTYDEWDACVAAKGCAFSPDDRGAGRGKRPIGNLSWEDTQQYVAWLSKRTGQSYRLPTEAEWEYAARAGRPTTYFWGKMMEKARANCSGCDGARSTAAVAVATYPPNDFGLHDMSGNLAEWVEDCWNDSYKSAPANGSAWVKPGCKERVLRGGSFSSEPQYVRSASRFKYDFDVRFQTNGFRVARER